MKLLKIICIVCICALLTSCNNVSDNVSSESISEVESHSQSESSAPESSAPEISYESTDLLDKVPGIGAIYKKTASTNETHKEIVEGKNGTLNTAIDVPATDYWITDVEGRPLIDHPFDIVYYADSMPDWGGHEDTPKEYLELPVIMGCYRGDFYRYYLVDGTFVLDAHRGYSCYDPRSDGAAYGYIYTYYYYQTAGFKYGLNDSNGNVIFDPVFTDGIYIPFEDRFVGTINNIDWALPEEGYKLLLDKDKNILAAYTSIRFCLFDDGTYIGLAGYSGYGDDWGHVLRDKNGEILKVGYRFIDRDGNEVSKCFNDVKEFWNVNSPSDIITAVDENGSTIEIKASDYICKP